MIATVVGIVLALAVGVFGRLVGLDRERAFYATVLAVVASLYALFATVGGTREALALECIFVLGFIGLTVVGFRLSPWYLVAGLAGHGVFDFFHGYVIANEGVPVWWPAFCGSYDIVAAAFLAWLIRSGRASEQLQQH